ncbi:MAG: 4-hydroxy-3-methylbut-2-enyl diphosphate reductase [Elusimicrobia bacterium RIFOXYC2_FULL_34_12]|nr:MAG: 4-hydroxy-3-methylbut-2-enyl diphosphate reductase [Elusimicrobia bacterium RIFOXYC2_FULL_34_12]OGS39446.1 MAG: 4-hydroxy-3-methylbut-2-enyl diphosphate reductase [Elusimicrobia bacterium RIFOXYD2_FULL_34_30]HAM39240.1 4-hydroxy-3-methylbut-2-enyl diphosphate reductase [Elusimicrobiota bacterium]
MKIIVAKNSGFCFGVRRAIDLAKNFSKNIGNIYTIGPIIHNPQVVDKLEKSGIKVIKRLSDVKNGHIVIRAHGIPKKVLNDIKKKGMKVLDATCPYVTRSKKYIEELAKEGYKVVIIGNPNHPEIKYIASYAPKDKVILISLGDIKRKIKFSKKIGIITQTTQSPENFINIVSKLLSYSNEFKIFNTICPDAINRQNEAVNLSKKSDVMIIIGGKNSANTKRLTAISKKIQPKTYHIETSGEIKDKWLKGAKITGIVAGASTPDWIITDVVDRIKGQKTN